MNEHTCIHEVWSDDEMLFVETKCSLHFCQPTSFSLGCGRWFARELAILDERCCPTCSATGWSRAFRHHRRLLIDGFSIFLQFLFWLVVSVLILNHLFGYVWDCLSISIPLIDVLQVVDFTFYPAFGMTSSLIWGWLKAMEDRRLSWYYLQTSAAERLDWSGHRVSVAFTLW